MTTIDCDLLIVGAGPAGLSAAINAASEGIRVCMLDSAEMLGGSAVASSGIENYPGFPEAITGQDLMNRMVEQALKFGTEMYAPLRASDIVVDGKRKIVRTDDFQEFASPIVLLTCGTNYRRHGAKGIAPLLGKGVFYGLPSGGLSHYTDKTVLIVGAANSAGQAVLKLMHNHRCKVKVVARGRLQEQMSKYIIDRIHDAPNVEILEETEVVEVRGKGKLECAVLVKGDAVREEPADYLVFFIGAIPHTAWLSERVNLTDKKFIKTGRRGANGRWKLNRDPLGLETCMHGVFAAGDNRDESTKRVAAASGEGSAALQQCHVYLRLQE